MKTIKQISSLALTSLSIIASFALAGCDGDDTVPVKPPVPVVDAGKADVVVLPVPDGGPVTPPPAPALGAQIDRFGRPAVNTALNHTFDPVEATANAAKDKYNSDSNPSTWKASYAGEFASNLAIYDALDSNCGNQFAAKAGAPAADTYAGLAGVLADDRLYVNTAGATCTTYLAVEANATAIIPNADCGGRKLDYDVIDVTYSALAIGALTGVGDAIPAVAAKTNGTTFPYLAPPQ
jgi:Domain of unknown function (DUF4331)